MHGFADDIDMAVGDGIERSGKECNAWIGARRGLARVPSPRKAATSMPVALRHNGLTLCLCLRQTRPTHHFCRKQMFFQ
jgi:hypothetical protein